VKKKKKLITVVAVECDDRCHLWWPAKLQLASKKKIGSLDDYVVGTIIYSHQLSLL
jgi:hypothetical protein